MDANKGGTMCAMHLKTPLIGDLNETKKSFIYKPLKQKKYCLKVFFFRVRTWAPCL